MATCVIDVNDIELRAARGDLVTASPGYAAFVNGQVEIGTRALAQALLHPRATENRYWRDLNTAPIQHFGKRIRHHADLAFLHLEHLRGIAGTPTEAMFAVPGSMTHEQLALLLGVAQAARLRPLCLVDSAVAAAAAALDRGYWAHLDLQQHQAVITGLEVGDDVTRGTVEVIPGIGLNRLRLACVQVVTTAFVTHCRFDPLHHAATEQLLHDQLPAWLALLAEHAEIRVQLEFRGNRFDTRVDRAAIIAAVAPLLGRLRAALPAGVQTVASHRLSAQPGFSQVFGPTPSLGARAVFTALQVPPGDPTDQGLRLITTLPATRTPSIMSQQPAPAGPAGGAPTHLLDHHTAAALGTAPLYLLSRGGYTREADPAALCSVVRSAEGTVLSSLAEHRVLVNGRAVGTRTLLKPGDQITFAGATAIFVAITVLPEDAA